MKRPGTQPMSDQYDDAVEALLREVRWKWEPGSKFRTLAANLLRTQIAAALKPVEEERDRLKARVEKLVEHIQKTERGAPDLMHDYRRAEIAEAENARLRVQLEKAESDLDYSKGQTAHVMQNHDAAEQKLTEARGLLERVAGAEAREMAETEVYEHARYCLTADPAPCSNPTAHQLAQALLDSLKRVKALEKPAMNLLAVLHRDGGHHTGRVGFEQSCKDAEQGWYALIQHAEQVEARLAQLPPATTAAPPVSGWYDRPCIGPPGHRNR